MQSDFYDFEQHQKLWSVIPFIGKQIPSKTILTWTSERLRTCINTQGPEVYKQESHRDNKYRKAFYTEFSTPKHKHVYDFGCGGGFFALELCRKDYIVSLADINEDSLTVANRVLATEGFNSQGTHLISNSGKTFSVSQPYDIFHSVGVLHHTPYFREILMTAITNLNAGGQIWLMLYSDNLFKELTGVEVGPIDIPVFTHPHYNSYITHDPRGSYLDWYSPEKIEYLVGDFLHIVQCDYVGANNNHLIVKLEIKSNNEC